MKRQHLLLISVFTALLIYLPSFVSAQGRKIQNNPEYDEQPYHFGFSLAINEMNFTVKAKANIADFMYDSLQAPDLFCDSARVLGIESKPALGFTIGIVSNLRLAKYLDLRFIPSLSFGERSLVYSIQNYSEGDAKQFEIKKSIQTTYVDFPLLIKYKGKRINNIRPYLIGGVKYTLDLATQKKKKDNPDNLHVDLIRNDFHGELGTGFDFYNSFFKLGVELMMSYGFNDIIKRENNIYANSLDKLSGKMFQLSFTFE